MASSSKSGEVVSTEETLSAEEVLDESGAASEVDEDTSAALPLDIVFGALKNARRRKVLRYLNERDERVTLSDLAEHVAALENDTTPVNLSAQQRKRVYVGLYQCHLPKLDDMGVITFNRSRGHIERRDAASQLDAYLDFDDTTRRPWHLYYVGFMLVSTLAVILAVVTGIIQSIGATALLVGICAGMAGLAAFHTYEQRR